MLVLWGKKIDPSLEGFESPKSFGFFKQSRLYRLVKHPNAKAIGLPRLMLGESLVLTLCPQS
ncbi:hypothetical protein [Helicobacter pylori]|uniref:hypothetical protein n=1 Tax=Helicobacter pylori TaxID=210 RepID=UPI001F09DE29|nr:hypothetical protein [Helicobacter pylori]